MEEDDEGQETDVAHVDLYADHRVVVTLTVQINGEFIECVPAADEWAEFLAHACNTELLNVDFFKQRMVQ